ncbi:2-dehydro-3-deoxygalactonokinase [Rubellimicrobium thermophilum]|uniref:2-dehydro-3-deoxygalactonokinase n=1 Tax=Rubellimicrobium thermophilum TaxID=295419 RepID=UPI000590A4D6|nr:2-dehydro-3-deoxygalactonokinase [Rubellimicrobium thermophilum]
MRPDWIAVDWGTSNLRAWAMTEAGEPLAEARSDRGMGRLRREDFEGALRDIIGDWLGGGRMPVLICGMAGARQGWAEAGYARVPGPPLAKGLTPAPSGPDLDVRIVPGLAQDDPPDVMRGEETQVAGFLALNPGWDGVLCLPGTHSKWVRLSAGEVVGFRSFMTGELYAAIAAHTVLRHSLAGEGWDEGAFAAALTEGMARPEALASRLFAIRAESLLTALSPAAARARLSGLLIGAEIQAARGWWLGERVALIGTGRLAGHYRAALAMQGVDAALTDDTAVTLAGLQAARREQTGERGT